MNEPVRLLQSADVTDLERDLLRSWGAEQPAAGAQDRALAALGLGAAAVVGGAALAGGSVAPKAVGLGWMALAKWSIVGVLALGVTAGGVSLLSRREQTTVVPGATPARVVAHESTAQDTPAPKIVNLDSPTPAVAPAPHVQSSRPRPSSSLADQVAELDRARAALDTGDPAKARHLVDGYESTYPAGTLTQEAELLRIEALVREGNRTEAERVGKHFLGAYPKSPHTTRVRALLGYAP